jgi:hypothetical protein
VTAGPLYQLAGKRGLEESPDTAGQGRSGSLVGAPNVATEAAKADGKWNRKETAGRLVHDRVGKGETVG